MVFEYRYIYKPMMVLQLHIGDYINTLQMPNVYSIRDDLDVDLRRVDYTNVTKSSVNGYSNYI